MLVVDGQGIRVAHGFLFAACRFRQQKRPLK
jgi:hypothetical protein